jgi:hypothetical protein
MPGEGSTGGDAGGEVIGEVIGADSVVPGTHDSHAPQGSSGEQVTHES